MTYNNEVNYSSEISNKIKDAYKAYRRISDKNGNQSNEANKYFNWFCVACENENKNHTEIADLFRAATI